MKTVEMIKWGNGRVVAALFNWLWLVWIFPGLVEACSIFGASYKIVNVTKADRGQFVWKKKPVINIFCS